MSASTATQAGGNLFALAAATYGDFTGFWLLLQANALTDPMLQGLNTITTPPWQPSLTGGYPPQQ
jgi:hypothetical protein